MLWPSDLTRAFFGSESASSQPTPAPPPPPAAPAQREELDLTADDEPEQEAETPPPRRPAAPQPLLPARVDTPRYGAQPHEHASSSLRQPAAADHSYADVYQPFKQPHIYHPTPQDAAALAQRQRQQALPGHPLATPAAHRLQPAFIKPPAFAIAAASSGSTSRLPESGSEALDRRFGRQPASNSNNGTGLGGGHLFLQNQTKHIVGAKQFQSRNGQAWTGNAQHSDLHAYSPYKPSLDLPIPNPSLHPHAHTPVASSSSSRAQAYPSYPSYPSSTLPERRPSVPAHVLETLNLVDAEDYDPMARSGTSFKPRDPESYDHRAKKEEQPQAQARWSGPGKIGFGGSFYDDGPAIGSGGANGGRGGKKGGGGGYQAAPAPKRQQTTGRGVAGGNRLFENAISDSVSKVNRGGGRGQGQGKMVDQQEQEERRAKAFKDMEERDKEARKEKEDRRREEEERERRSSNSYEQTAAGFGPAPTPGSSSSRPRVIHQDDPQTAEEMAGEQRKQQVALAIKGRAGAKDKGKAPAKSKKGKGKETEVIDLAESDDELDDFRPAPRVPHRHEDPTDMISDDDGVGGADDPFSRSRSEGSNAQRRPSAPATTMGSKKKRASHAHVVDDHDDAPSSPDPLAMQDWTKADKRRTDDMAAAAGMPSVKERIAEYNRRTEGSPPVPPKKSMASGMQPKGAKRVADGSGEAGSEWTPSGASTSSSAMEKPKKGRVPRAAQSAIDAAQTAQSASGIKGLANTMLDVKINPPMFGGRGIHIDHVEDLYDLKINLSGPPANHKICISRRYKSSPPEDVVDFRVKDIKFMAHGPGNLGSAYLEFRLTDEWDKKRWQDLLGLCEIEASGTDKSIHLLFLNHPGADWETKPRSPEDHLFYNAKRVWQGKGKRSKPTTFEVKAKGILSTYTRCHSEALNTYSSLPKKKKVKNTQAKLPFAAVSSASAYAPAPLYVDEAGDYVQGDAPRRRSSRPSTSQLAEPSRQIPSSRRRDSGFGPENDLISDEAAEQRRAHEQRLRAKPLEPEKYRPEEVVLEYPMQRVPGVSSVSLTWGDTKRLNDEEFLNDTLIEFGLKRALEKVQQADTKRPEPERVFDQIHVFNSFFYKQLSTKVNKSKGSSYQLVEKWTKKVDLFRKKYIVVPINEQFHWYLAIIVNPAAILQSPPPPRKSARKSGAHADEAADLDIASSSSRQPSPATTSHHFGTSKKRRTAEASPDVDKMDVDGEEAKTAEEEAEEEDARRQQAAHIKAVAEKEAELAREMEGAAGAGDDEQALTLDLDDDHDVLMDHSTLVRPEVEGGGPPKKTVKSNTPKSSPGGPRAFSLDDDGADVDGEPIAVSESPNPRSKADEPQRPPLSQGKENNRPAEDAHGVQADEEEDDDMIVLASPTVSAPNGGKGKEKQAERAPSPGQNGASVDKMLVDRADDEASDTTAAEESDAEDSGADIERSLLDRPTSAQPPAKKASAPPPRKKVAVPIGVPTEPPKEKTPPPREPTPPPPPSQPREVPPVDSNLLSSKCWILTFDSLGSGHPAVVKKLAEYLVSEAKSKLKRTEDDIDPSVIEGFRVDVPQQPNFCDCGLYLLHFVEQFLTNPDYYLNLTVSSHFNRPKRPTAAQAREIKAAAFNDWDEGVAIAKRADMREEVKGLMDVFERDVMPERKKAEEQEREEKRKRKEEREREKAAAAAAGGADSTAGAAQGETTASRPASPPAPAQQPAEQAAPSAEPAASLARKTRSRKKVQTPPPELTISDDESSTASPPKPQLRRVASPPPAPVEPSGLRGSPPADPDDMFAEPAGGVHSGPWPPPSGRLSPTPPATVPETPDPVRTRRATYGADLPAGDEPASPRRDRSPSTGAPPSTFGLGPSRTTRPRPPSSPDRPEHAPKRAKHEEAPLGTASTISYGKVGATTSEPPKPFSTIPAVAKSKAKAKEPVVTPQKSSLEAVQGYGSDTEDEGDAAQPQPGDLGETQSTTREPSTQPEQPAAATVGPSSSVEVEPQSPPSRKSRRKASRVLVVKQPEPTAMEVDGPPVASPSSTSKNSGGASHTRWTDDERDSQPTKGSLAHVLGESSSAQDQHDGDEPAVADMPPSNQQAAVPEEKRRSARNKPRDSSSRPTTGKDVPTLSLLDDD
ncbi:hypothetical protein JCM10207_003612 [Rhodosporidiobolus poonsookiae]